MPETRQTETTLPRLVHEQNRLYISDLGNMPQSQGLHKPYDNSHTQHNQGNGTD